MLFRILIRGIGKMKLNPFSFELWVLITKHVFRQNIELISQIHVKVDY